MLSKEEREKQQQDIMSKIWNDDIFTLSQQEITSIMRNLFYQLFLIEIMDLNFAIRTNDKGTFVKFVIEGEAFKDSDSLDISEKIDFIATDEMEE